MVNMHKQIITILFLFLTIVACTEQQSPVLRLGTNVWPGYEPLYLAREKNYLADNKIRLVEFSSSSQSIQAFRNGLIDAAALTLDEVLLLLQYGEKIKIILVMDISDGGDAIIAVKGLNKLSDLKGKRIGVENNAVGAYVISRALQIAGLNKTSVNIIQVDIDKQENAFLKKEIDAVVTFEPVRSKLINAGGKQIFDSRQLPGEIVDVLVVRDDYLKINPQNIQYLLDAWYKSLSFFRKQPQAAAEIIGKRMKLNVKDTLASYQGLKLPSATENQNLVQGKDPGLSNTLKKMMTSMLEQGLINKKIDISPLFSQIKFKHN